MYIRWKDQARASERIATHPFGNGPRSIKISDVLLSAYLAESERVEGKPRQKAIYLASIRKSQLGNAAHRQWFWQRVAAKIAPLDLPIEQQRTLKAKLNERVPDV